MKVIKWLASVLFVAMLLLTACNQKEDASGVEAGDMPLEAETQPDSVVEESAPADTSQKVEEEVSEDVGEDQGEEIDTVDETGPKTLLDAEAMVDYLGSYLLRPDDMPHKYFVPDGGEQRASTMRLIQSMGEIEAKTYVKETGRIDGWWLQLQRTSKADFAPGTFESSIELFQDANGAQMAMSPGYYALYQDESREYSRVEGGCDLGDQCEFFYSEKEDPATELITAQYTVAFTYKNAFAWVMARGLQIDMDADYVLDAARVVFEKLEEAPTQ